MRKYLRITFKWIVDKTFEKQRVKMQSGFNWLKTACSILKKVINPPEFIKSRNFLNNYVIISYLRNTLHYAVSCTALDMAKS